MATSLSRPRVSRSALHLQLSYELPHRIHAAKVYPLKSSNGSTVIIYAHENGVTVSWRGGRPFKTASEGASTPKKANGTGNAVIALDSDDEDDLGGAFEDKPEFEDSEEELDPSRPYPNIIQTLDLCTSSDVLHLALLPASILKADGSSRGLDPLRQKLIFAAACADKSVRLITLPLTPPSPASKARRAFRTDFTLANAGNGKWGEQVTLLNGHQKPSDGVSMTLNIPGNSKEPVKADSQIIVASHSREITGRLLLWRIPLQSPKSTTIEPFQAIYLSSPARSISFNPSVDKKHDSHLLVAESTGVCRVYDYRLLIKTPSEEPNPSALEIGSWLLSLYPGFHSDKADAQAIPHLGSHAGFGRKTISDAQWVAGGSAVIALLSDGEWGIWDIEGVGPRASQGLLGRHGIQGGALSEYSASGYIDPSIKSRSTGPPQVASTKFAPMTPGTRKSTEPFGGRGSNATVRGQISVLEVESKSPTSPSGESVLFWLGETFAIIPSLSIFWTAQARNSGRSGDLFNGPSSARMSQLDVNLQGECCSGIEQIPNSSSSIGPSVDIMILGEHRFAVLTGTKPTREQVAERSVVSGRLALAEKGTNGGELDVVGIEQALTRMENGNGANRTLFLT